MDGAIGPRARKGLRRSAPGVAVVQAADPREVDDVGFSAGALLDWKLVRVGSVSIDRIVAVSPAEKMASRSKIMKRGADSKGKVSRSRGGRQERLPLRDSQFQ